ncbi:MAG TPA: dTMP kinase [Polyangia bacterium]|jgi:dTMP kinase
MNKLIAIEGIDGAGTTTQCERLARHFDLHLTREPSDRPIGRLLRGILRHEIDVQDEKAVALLFAADRLDHLGGEIILKLHERSVITDRYVMSSIVYQSLAVDRGFVAAINQHARPADLTILVDVDVAVAESRRQGRGGPSERYDRRATQERLAAAYRTEAQHHGAVIVDGNGDADSVFGALVPLVQSCLGQR